MTELGGFGSMQCSNHKNGSCGTVFQNVQIKIVDPKTGKVLGPNQLGELWIKTVTMMNGYYRNLEATKNTVDEQGKNIMQYLILIIYSSFFSKDFDIDTYCQDYDPK